MSKPQHWLSVERVIEASADDLYLVWTDPEAMGAWMGQRVEADVRVGGRYRIENQVEDRIFYHEGEFRLLEPGRRVVMTFSTGPAEALDGALPFTDEFIDATFLPLGPLRTLVRLFNGWNGEEMSEEAREAIKAGWSAWLDQLAALF